MYQIQKGNKIALVAARTFGGYRVFLYNAYFDSEEEVYFETKQEADDYANFWITTDWHVNQVII